MGVDGYRTAGIDDCLRDCAAGVNGHEPAVIHLGAGRRAAEDHHEAAVIDDRAVRRTLGKDGYGTAGIDDGFRNRTTAPNGHGTAVIHLCAGRRAAENHHEAAGNHGGIHDFLAAVNRHGAGNDLSGHGEGEQGIGEIQGVCLMIGKDHRSAHRDGFALRGIGDGDGLIEARRAVGQLIDSLRLSIGDGDGEVGRPLNQSEVVHQGLVR